MSLPERSAAFVMQLLIHIEQSLVDSGLDKKEAEAIATGACDELRKNFGGEHFYLPIGRGLNAIIAHHAIYKKFTGNNHTELAKEFGVSITHVYRVVKAGYKQELDERQPGLF